MIAMPDSHAIILAQQEDNPFDQPGGTADQSRDPCEAAAIASAIDQAQERGDAALAGMSDKEAGRTAASLYRIWSDGKYSHTPSNTGLDLTMARLLAHHGIDPLAALWLATLRREPMTIIDTRLPARGADADRHAPNAGGTRPRRRAAAKPSNPGAIVARIDPGGTVESGLGSGRRPDFTGTMCVIGRGWTWDQRGRLRTTVLPDTIRLALEGRPLVDLVDPPILSRLGLRILETDTDEEGRTIIHTDHQAKAAGLGDLMAITPRGTRSTGRTT